VSNSICGRYEVNELDIQLPPDDLYFSQRKPFGHHQLLNKDITIVNFLAMVDYKICDFLDLRCGQITFQANFYGLLIPSFSN
jgi:hypothetical protein